MSLGQWFVDAASGLVAGRLIAGHRVLVLAESQVGVLCVDGVTDLEEPAAHLPLPALLFEHLAHPQAKRRHLVGVTAPCATVGAAAGHVDRVT